MLCTYQSETRWLGVCLSIYKGGTFVGRDQLSIHDMTPALKRTSGEVCVPPLVT